MTRILRLLVLFALIAPIPAPAADYGVGGAKVRAWSATASQRAKARPFPVSRRARDIRLADACWHGCQVGAGRAFQGCLRRRGLTDCVLGNDAADRTCLRTCRISGGPWLNLAE